MTTDIRRATTAHEISDVRNFWYDIYVCEMGRHKSDGTANHLARELPDAFDQLGNLYVAWENGKVVGTVLATRGDQSEFGYYERLYCLEGLSDAGRIRSSITNKLIVAPEKRKSSLAIKLAATIYREGLRRSIRRNYIDCNEHLVDFFHRLGFRAHRGWVTHKDYGPVYSLVLDLEDIDHLRVCRSPLVSQYESFQRKLNQPQIIGVINSDRTSPNSAAV